MKIVCNGAEKEQNVSNASKQRSRERKYDKGPVVPVLGPDPCQQMEHALEILVLAVDEFMSHLESHASEHGLNILDFPKNDELREACDQAWRMRDR